MKLIAWGLLFFFFDISVQSVCVTPAFVGYILSLVGMSKQPEREIFSRKRPLILVAAVVGVITWALANFGAGLGVPGIVLKVVAGVEMILKLLVTYQLFRCFVELEELYRVELYVDSMKRGWIIMAVGLVVSYGLSWIRMAIPIVASSILAVAVAVVYITMFHKSMKAYEGREKAAEKSE